MKKKKLMVKRNNGILMANIVFESTVGFCMALLTHFVTPTLSLDSEGIISITCINLVFTRPPPLSSKEEKAKKKKISIAQ